MAPIIFLIPIEFIAVLIYNLIWPAKGSEGFDVSPGGTELWTAGSEDGIISIIDPSAKKIKDKN